MQVDENTPPPAAHAGWHPGPDGQQRYWNGTTWLDVPPPDVHPGVTSATESRAGRLPRLRTIVVIAASLALLLAVGLTAIGVQRAGAAKEAAALEAQQAHQQAQKEHEKEAAAAAKRAADDAERDRRTHAVDGVEKSIKKMAKEHAKEGIIRGPIIDVSCDPVAGGSVEDLTEKTTTFQCFVANKDNKDGTMSGYYYHATMNWDTGSYTYGFGESQ